MSNIVELLSGFFLNFTSFKFIFPVSAYTVVPNISKIVVAIILISVGILVVSGGLKRVSSILKRSVPIMFIFYFIISLIVIIINIKNLPMGIANVFKYAFTF